MMSKIRSNMEEMFKMYTEHKATIEKIMNDSSSCHRENEEKMKHLITEKSRDLLI
jgi:formate-dependent nitrite reductase cytochrome c552 subunit